MQRITLLTVGKIKASWAAEGCEEYRKRLKGHVRLDVLEIPASKQKDPEKQRAEESERLLSSLPKQPGETWLLDEKGERLASHEFAFFLGQAQDAGTSLTFLLGGAYGVSDALRSQVRRQMRLSDMTLPHELCRVLFLEQLYRACEIRKGSGYHH